MSFKLEELSQTLVAGAVTFATLVYVLSVIGQWLGKRIDPLVWLDWIDELMRLKPSKLLTLDLPVGSSEKLNEGVVDSDPISRRLVQTAKSGIVLALIFTCGLFSYDVAHDFGAERHTLSALVDDYMDTDFSLRLRSVFRVPCGTSEGVLVCRTPLYVDVMSTLSTKLHDFPKPIGDSFRRLQEHVSTSGDEKMKYVTVTNFDDERPYHLKQLREDVNRLFYQAKNRVYREDKYCDELRELEAQSAFFRSLLVASFVVLVVSVACLIPRVSFSMSNRRAIAVGLTLFVTLWCWYYVALPYLQTQVSIGLFRLAETMVQPIYTAKHSEWYHTVVSWGWRTLHFLVHVIPPIIDIIIVWVILSYIRSILLKMSLVPDATGPIETSIRSRVKVMIAISFTAVFVFSYTYSQEASNYNRRVFGYYESLLSPSYGPSSVAPSNFKVGATVYVLRSGEYAASCIQAYNVATSVLTQKLSSREESSNLPPAVILDLDETVIDNAAFQSWLVQNNRTFSEEAWQRFANNAPNEIRPVPGSVDFIQEAMRKKVAVYYISNRRETLRSITVQTMRRFGIWPDTFDETRLLLLADGERDRSKVSRIQKIKDRNDVQLLIGDSLRDFGDPAFELGSEHLGLKQYANKIGTNVIKEGSNFGVNWIVLPNPIYGDWEGAAGPSLKDALESISIDEENKSEAK